MSEYDEWTSDELEAELRSRGLPTSGTKAVRLARLEADDAAGSEEGGAMAETPETPQAETPERTEGPYPDQIAYADDPNEANAPKQADTTLAESTQAAIDAAAEHPGTYQLGDEESEDTPAGNTHVTRTHSVYGYKVGQVIPPEKEPDPALAERAEQYLSARSECPYCHVPDGVREGMNHCDSCGAHWQSENTEGAAATT